MVKQGAPMRRHCAKAQNEERLLDQSCEVTLGW
jgi:hypothetical protein